METSTVGFSFTILDTKTTTNYDPSKNAHVSDMTITATTVLADAEIEEAKKEWEDLVLSDEE